MAVAPASSRRQDSGPEYAMLSPGSNQPAGARRFARARGLFFLSAWCGLTAGFLEMGTRVALRAVDPSQRLYTMTRHFVWLGPVSNLVLFLGLGLILAAAVTLAPRAGNWFARRLLCALTILPALMAAWPRIYTSAWLLVACGVALTLVPIVEQYGSPLRKWASPSFALMTGLTVALATCFLAQDRLALSTQTQRDLPPANSPNVLLIVLDTVRADRLSLYGYERPTTPNLERLAKRGIRFQFVRATAPWTLPSHASMFTGHWPHELIDEWMTPLDARVPMLAEYLGEHGYATAGFVANLVYCSQNSGLARGFTHYEDYILQNLSPLRTAGLVHQASKAIFDLINAFDIVPLHPLRDAVHRWFVLDQRKDAAAIDRAFLHWLTERQQPQRPFFAFLNFLDAHQPYVLPPRAPHPFLNHSPTRDEYRAVCERWEVLDKTKLPPSCITLARDLYDDGLKFIDDQLGLLFDELGRRGVLDHTLIIVTSDHGEGLGEHGLFDHGESLYQTEIRVPLLIVPPSGLDSPVVVDETVSLRDLPATIVGLAGMREGSPFPGESLSRFWRHPIPTDDRSPREHTPVISELAAPNPLKPNQGRSPASHGPLISLSEGGYVYIRNDKDGSEHLFNEREDPREIDDRAHLPSMRPVLERLRAHLDEFRQNHMTGTSHGRPISRFVARNKTPN